MLADSLPLTACMMNHRHGVSCKYYLPHRWWAITCLWVPVDMWTLMWSQPTSLLAGDWGGGGAASKVVSAAPNRHGGDILLVVFPVERSVLFRLTFHIPLFFNGLYAILFNRWMFCTTCTPKQSGLKCSEQWTSTEQKRKNKKRCSSVRLLSEQPNLYWVCPSLRHWLLFSSKAPSLF